MKDLFLKADEYSRRQIVKGMAAGFLGLHFGSNTARAATSNPPGGGKAKSVIFIRVKGGLSQVDSFDIKEANTDAMKASAPIKSSADGIRVGKWFPGIAKHMDKFAVINSMYHTQGAHGVASYLMDKGYEKRGTVVHPDLGAWVSKLAKRRSGDIPPYVKIGRVNSLGTGFFSSKYAALPITAPDKGLRYIHPPKDVSASTYAKRLNLLDLVNKELEAKVKSPFVENYHQAYLDTVKLMNSKDLEVFDLNKETAATRKMYGEDQFGHSCLLARRLIEKGVGFATVTSSGWDHHYGIYEDFKSPAGELDRGVSALMSDLKSRGLLDSTLVVFTTEFGRSAHLNGRVGRNHNPIGFTTMLAGGGIKGGQKYGKTDDQGKKAVENKVGFDDFNATIAYALGIPLEHIEMSPEGRPFKVGNKKGKPITALF